MTHPSNRPSVETLDDLVTYHPPRPDQIPRYGSIRTAARELIRVILEQCPDCADRAAAVRKVREGMMTANAAIALSPPTEPALVEAVRP